MLHSGAYEHPAAAAKVPFICICKNLIKKKDEINYDYIDIF